MSDDTIFVLEPFDLTLQKSDSIDLTTVDPTKPVPDFMPGTDEKIWVLRERANKGLPLWVDGDGVFGDFEPYYGGGPTEEDLKDESVEVEKDNIVTEEVQVEQPVYKPSLAETNRACQNNGESLLSGVFDIRRKEAELRARGVLL